MAKPMEFEERPLGEGAHWRKFYDSRVLRWWHLPAKDITLLIETITELEGKVGRESKLQLMARFKGARLPFALNATNCTTLEQLYGEDPHGWFGKRVTLYVTTTEMAGKTVSCIRIRPSRPKGKTGPRDAQEPEPELNESAQPPAAEQAPEADNDGR